MKSARLLPGLAAVTGLAGAVCYALFLARGYDHTIDLPVDGQPWLGLLIAVTAIALVLACVCAFGLPAKFEKETAFEHFLGGDSTGLRLGGVLGAFLLIGGGALGLFGVYTSMQTAWLTQDVTAGAVRPDFALIALYLLALLTGAVLLPTLRLFRQVSESAAALTILPIFWSALDMIVTFKQNGANPMMPLYFWELLGAGALTLGFYQVAALLFAPPRPRRLAAMLTCAVSFALMSAVGVMAAMALSPDLFSMDSLARHLCLFGGTVWCAALLLRLSRTHD